MKFIGSIKDELEKKKGWPLAVYLILRILVIVCMIRQIMLGNMGNVFTCVLTLILFLIPCILDRTFKIDLPDTLEIIIYVFIFSAEILGEINEFYIHIENFDTILHTLNGFIMAGIGFSLIEIFNNNPNTKLSLNPKYLVLFGFCFSMTTGVVWEIFEYSVDVCLNKDMQKDTIITEMTSVILNEEGKNIAETIHIDNLVINGEDYTLKYGGYIDIGFHDTMEDLIVNLIGAVAFSIMGYAHSIGKGKNASKFMITRSY